MRRVFVVAFSTIAVVIVACCLVHAQQTADATDVAVFPDEDWPRLAPDAAGMSADLLQRAEQYALTGGGSGCVIRNGHLIWSWGDQHQRYDLKSTTKSIGAVALGIAVADGKISLDQYAVQYQPSLGVPPESNRESGWLEKVTIRQLATHTAGFEKSGGYGRILFGPGTRWAYSDAGPNWLAECITLAYRRDVAELMFERVFTPLGISHDELTWRDNSYRPVDLDGIRRREFGSGISASVDALARIGYLHRRQGRWNGNQILPRAFVDEAARSQTWLVGLPVERSEEYGNASGHYGLLWWNNNDGAIASVPKDAFWSWGLYDSLIVVIPSLDIVIARAGDSWRRDSESRRATADVHYEVLRPFLEPIAISTGFVSAEWLGERESAESVASSPRGDLQAAAYPLSQTFAGIRWADASTIVRYGHGSDNWPITWAADDLLYTAFGDGRGFEPYVPEKLSMGLSAIRGSPPHLSFRNIRAASVESYGPGAEGRKASGMLMVDGVLYLLARNCGNSQLAWSNDGGQSWNWADWRWQTSFGYPTFLNFGRNYEGAHDSYVYVYSHDSSSAYERADRMVLARVPHDQLTERNAYEFFERLDEQGMARWTRDVDKRGAVFTSPGKCYRSSVSYHAAAQVYLWCQTGLGEDPRAHGGLAIYDAPHPWGPWTTVYAVDDWDVGPGETSCIPTKWISADGSSFLLAFSGDDCFSLRRGELLPAN